MTDSVVLPSYSCLNLTLRDRVCWIELNRPKKKNAFNFAMYSELIAAFSFCATSPAVHVVVLTGSPESKPKPFYSSGNDLGNFVPPTDGSEMDLPAMTQGAGDLCRRFVDAFILFPKALIAAVNGPAFGVAVTTLLLCDLVFTNTQATFQTPFTALGQNPEGCSSILFSQRLGQRANRMLLLGETLTAKEAERLNFSSGMFPDDTFLGDVHAQAAKLANFPLHSVMASKQLVRRQQIPALLAANADECRVLTELLNHPDTMQVVMNRFMQMKQPKAKL